MRDYGRSVNHFAASCWLGIALAVALLPPRAALASEWHYDGVQRVVAISDVHGAYDAMLSTLRSAVVIDEQQGWVAGDTHLVITGDLLDRGPDSRQVMDLIIRLEKEAEAAGGRVHQLIGNHEVMNLVGDLRYVAVQEYAAFADDESEEEREQWFQRFVAGHAEPPDEAAMRAKFAESAPPGFFAHRRAFRADGYYGSWLLEKPLMVVIDGTAFVHGGISPFVAEYGLDGINGTLAGELERYVMNMNQLEDAGMLSPMDSFYDHDGLLQALPAETPLPPELRAAADTVIALNGSEIHGPNSPLWYRGSVGCSELIEGDALDAALARIDANRAVIGHTPTLTRRILQRMHGRIIEIDTGMLNAAYKGSGNALVIEGDTLTVVNQTGASNSPPEEHPRRVGFRPDAVDAATLESMLGTGKITAAGLDADGRTVLTISANGVAVAAWFDPKPRKKGFYPELAAYKLDRALGLDMVPATVRYAYEGKDGTLQFKPASYQSEQERAASGRGSSAWCPLPAQWGSMYIYDALIHNKGRLPGNMLYSQDNWQIMLTDHSDAFSNKKGRPPYVKDMQFDISSYWVKALQRLDDTMARAELGDVLDKKQISALLKRRDSLLVDAAL